MRLAESAHDEAPPYLLMFPELKAPHLRGALSRSLLGASSTLSSEAHFQFVNRNSTPSSRNSSVKRQVVATDGFFWDFSDKVLRQPNALPLWSLAQRRAPDRSHLGLLCSHSKDKYHCFWEWIVFFSPVPHSIAQSFLHCSKAKFHVSWTLWPLWIGNQKLP